MRLTFIIYSLMGGGAERFLTNLSNSLSKNHDISIITFSPLNTDFYPLSKNIKRISINSIEENLNIFSAIYINLKRIYKLKKEIKKIKPDIIITLMPAANVLTILANITLKYKLIIQEQIHPPELKLPFIWEFLRKRTYFLADRTIALTNKSALWLKENCNLKNVLVIPNPVKYPIEKNEPFLDINKIINSNDKIIISVGRLDGQKGFDTLIKIFSTLYKSYSNWKLIIIGEGQERKNLEDLILKLNLKEKVFLPGKTGNIEDFYKMADIFTLTSRFEGFPNVLIEAMSYGVASIAFDCDTGPRDIIKNNINGILVENNNIENFKIELEKLMGDEHLRKKLSLKAIEVKETFSIEKISKLWEDLFKDLHNF